MSQQILTEYQQYLSEDGFKILKEFLECVESKTIFRPHTKSILCFLGSGSNGKTTLVNKIKELVGLENFSDIYAEPDGYNDPDQSEEFDNVDYRQFKQLVICNEFSQPAQYSILKQLSGNVSVFCRQVNEDGSSFMPEHNLICVLNSLQNLEQDLLNRFVIIEFTHVF